MAPVKPEPKRNPKWDPRWDPLDSEFMGDSLPFRTRSRDSKVPSRPAKVAKRANGLLNTTIGPKSYFMTVAVKNSLESPLLRLPAEIRTKIWEYALGGNKIYIRSCYDQNMRPIQDRVRYSVSPLDDDARTWVSPNFQLPQVCRQMYIETALLIYSQNSFGVDSTMSFNIWVRQMKRGQKRAVVWLTPAWRLLLSYGYGRSAFTSKFPNLQRITFPQHHLHISDQLLEDLKADIRSKEHHALEVDYEGN